MPDWLESAAQHTAIPTGTMAVRLAIAALAGLVIAGVYRLSHGRLARDARTLSGTLVLLTILLAMVTMVIGDSVARAFGLVGALSIVRFRTVVEDTRDTAFVIFAVVAGMAIGTGLILVAAVGVPIVSAAAILLAARPGTGLAGSATLPPTGEHTLVVRLGAGQDQAPIAALLSSKAQAHQLTAIATARQGAAIDLTYLIRLPDPARAPGLVADLNTVPGVQSIDLRASSSPA